MLITTKAAYNLLRMVHELYNPNAPPPNLLKKIKFLDKAKNLTKGERFITTINLSLSKEIINYDINFLDYLRVHRNPMLVAGLFIRYNPFAF